MSCGEDGNSAAVGLNPVQQNGSIGLDPDPPQLSIDESLLVDPKLLFIGSKIGEGAHGKVYEGR